MSEGSIDEATPFQQFVLLTVADLDSREETPAHSYDVKRTCESYGADLEGELFGGVTRQQVINALSALEEAGLLDEEEVQSPVGKWRPAYALSVPRETVLDALADDDRLGPVVARIRRSED